VNVSQCCDDDGDNNKNTENLCKTNLISMKRLSLPSGDLSRDDNALPPFASSSGVDSDSKHSTPNSYLATANIFGSVVKGFKKPGHHIVGPAKNPLCPCYHCREHFLERASVDKSLAFSTARLKTVPLEEMSASLSEELMANYMDSSGIV